MAYGFSDNKRLCKVGSIFSCAAMGEGNVTLPQTVSANNIIAKELCKVRYTDLYNFILSNAGNRPVMAEICVSSSSGNEKINVVVIKSGLGVDKNNKKILWRNKQLDRTRQKLTSSVAFEVEECIEASCRISVYFGSIRISVSGDNDEYVTFEFSKDSSTCPNPYTVRYKDSGAEYNYNTTPYNNLVFRDIRFITT